MLTQVDCQVLKSSLKTILAEAKKLGLKAAKIQLEAEASIRWIDQANDEAVKRL